MLFNHGNSFAARFVLTLALLAGLFGVVPVSPVYAATITVPDNYSTIQAAINAAHAGDTIVVRAGTYSENLTVDKDIILTAASFDSNDPTRNTTVISARSSTRPVITIVAGGGWGAPHRGVIKQKVIFKIKS
jgi:pectin methylesterase-like acyl-CoA thioesterase